MSCSRVRQRCVFVDVLNVLVNLIKTTSRHFFLKLASRVLVNKMAHGHRLCCILCRRSEETKITGPLSTKCEVTAHQNCLLYASAIFCQESPLHDDLFGFSVDAVLEEEKRGKKLKCHQCKKNGATAGCENSRCKKSYHYPCAVEEGARLEDNTQEGKFALYCLKHSQLQNNTGFLNGHNTPLTKPKTSKNPGEAAPSKVYCLVCEKKEGNISLESLSPGIAMLYCAKHAPSSLKRNGSRGSPGPGTSTYGSDSNSSSCSRLSSKRRISSDSDEQESLSKRKSNGCQRRILEESPASEENPPHSECAPLEHDIDESLNSVQEPEPPTESQLIREDTESHTASISERPREDESGNEDDVTFIDSDAESESLLLPVMVCMDSELLSVSTADQTVQTEVKSEPSGSSPGLSPVPSPDQQPAELSVAEQSPPASPPSPDHSEPGSINSPLCISAGFSAAPHESISITIHPPPPSPPALPSASPEPSLDSTSFWRSCNAAGCTRAIFTDFMNDMNLISGRIQSDQASQEDYDRALKVIEASGKLAELVTNQQKDLERKQRELEKAAAAMTELISLLKRGVSQQP